MAFHVDVDVHLGGGRGWMGGRGCTGGAGPRSSNEAPSLTRPLDVGPWLPPPGGGRAPFLLLLFNPFISILFAPLGTDGAWLVLAEGCKKTHYSTCHFWQKYLPPKCMLTLLIKSLLETGSSEVEALCLPPDMMALYVVVLKSIDKLKQSAKTCNIECLTFLGRGL